MANLLDGLNKEQRAAVKENTGPVLVLAGAGSGKTRVLTYKVAYLMKEKKIAADNILMVTFTNKAASEMKERIRKLIVDDANGSILPFAGTFHSFGAKVLRKEGIHIGLNPNFVIYDTNDSKNLIREIMKRMDIDTKKFNPGTVLACIEGAKNELLSFSEYGYVVRGYWQQIVAKIYVEYQKSLKESVAVDFGDLIYEAVRIFKNNKEVLKRFQDRYQFVLVDEYQDTNKAQYELTTMLSGKWKNLCVVGDCSQSIYKFRGADYRNVLSFKKKFSQVKVFNLERNYRSTQKILDCAYSVISKNDSHPVLDLWTKNDQGETIKVYQARNEKDEARYVVDKIKERVREGRSLISFAVLYRTNAQSRVLEEAFLKTGITYTIVGGIRFYERKEIKDVLSYLRLIYNPKDMISRQRAGKVGKRRLGRFESWRKKNTKKFEGMETKDILEEILEVTEYKGLYLGKKTEEDFTRLENISELGSVAEEFNVLGEFLENVSLAVSEGADAKDVKKEAVTLMTMHAAKGLEFESVFLVGMEEGLFPHSRSLMEKEELEEERRLCYVGMTRAKDNLYLTYCLRRLYFGARMNNPVSRFIEEVPSKLVEYEGGNSLEERGKEEKYIYDKNDGFNEELGVWEWD